MGGYEFFSGMREDALVERRGGIKKRKEKMNIWRIDMAREIFQRDEVGVIEVIERERGR